MYTVRGDGVIIYSDVSASDSVKATAPKLQLKDNAAGSLEVTLSPGNAGYDILKRMTSEIVVYRDGLDIWSGRILSEKMDFWNNRILVCEGELSYLHDTIQPQKKYKNITIGLFLENVLAEHNKHYTDDEERYKFYVDRSVEPVYNYDEVLEEAVTDFNNTFDAIQKNIIDKFKCHLILAKHNGKKYFKIIKEDQPGNENTQVIRFGENLLDFIKSWDLTEMGTVLVPRGKVKEKEADEDSDAFNSYVTLSDIPYENTPERSEYGHYLRNDDGSLYHEGEDHTDVTSNLVYEWYNNMTCKTHVSTRFELCKSGDDYIWCCPECNSVEGNPIYQYEVDENNYIILERDSDNNPTIRVNLNDSHIDEDKSLFIRMVELLEDGVIVGKVETDGLYANVYFPNDDGEFYCLKDTYGRVEKVVDLNDKENSIDLLKATRDYLLDNRFDDMTLEVSAVDLRYLSNQYEPLKILDRIRCISHPHGLNTRFTVSELSIQLDRVDSAKYTLKRTIETQLSSSGVSGAIGNVSEEVESPHSAILKQAQINADKMLRENVNGYVTLETDTEGGRHSQALIISSSKDYKRSEHFWIWNVNGLGHYQEYGDDKDGLRPTPDSDDQILTWADRYVLNIGITMDGSIVANRITVGHMSANRVRTGLLVSEDGNVIWNLNRISKYYMIGEDGEPIYTDEPVYDETTGELISTPIPGGSMMIKKGSIELGQDSEGKPLFSVDDNGYLKAESGVVGGFRITSSNINNDSMMLDETGLHLWEGIQDESGKKNFKDIGYIGKSYWENLPNKKALAMNLEPKAAAIWWARRMLTSDETYTVKLLYAGEDFDKYDADTLNIECDTDFHGKLAKKIWIDPNTGGANDGLNGNIWVMISPDAINDDGTVNKSGFQKVTLKNGFII